MSNAGISGLVLNNAVLPLYVVDMGYDQVNELNKVIAVDVNGYQYITGQVTLPSGQIVSTKNSLGANNPNNVSVGTSSGTVISTNLSRTGAVFTNLSNNIIYFGIGATALLNKGITLYPGGVWQMDEYSFSQAQINAIASGASSILAYQEFV